MAHSLHIKYDGDVTGLSEHRLSLSEFGTALNELLRAVRRSVSNCVVSADGAEHGSRGGRFAKVAECLDLQITSLRDGCVELDLEVTVAGQMDIFAIEEGLKDFVNGVAAESAAQRRNAAVRKYLQALPVGLKTHTYEAAHGDRVFATAIVTDTVELTEEEHAATGFMLVDADVTIRGVDFCPPAVRITSEMGKTTLKATDVLVARAIELRNQSVRVRYLPGPGRLLSIRDGAATVEPPSFAQTSDAVFERWDEVLMRLSR